MEYIEPRDVTIRTKSFEMDGDVSFLGKAHKS